MFLSIEDRHLATMFLSDPAFDLAGMMSQGIQELEKSAPERLPGIHASEVTKCLRMAKFTLNKEAKQGTRVDMLRRFYIGHAVHEMLQNAWTAACRARGGSVTFEPEVEIADTPLGKELNLRSKSDGVFTFLSPSGEPYARIGLEIKTEDPEAWKKLTRPRMSHIKQVQVYMAALSLPMMYFAYINKSTGETTPFGEKFCHVFDPDMWEVIKNDILRVLSSKSVYDLPRAAETFSCTICPYRGPCGPQDQGPPKFTWSK